MSIGYCIAYTLWVLKGSNRLDHLSYYSSHVNKMTDDEETLRGAYGPRLRNWIGADQLQECIDINKDIDRVEDYKKPEGIDQLQMVYRDLSNGINAVSCQIFNPSIDFDNSRYIPDLVMIGFAKKEKLLNLMAVYNSLPEGLNAKADAFLLEVMGESMSSVLGLTLNNIELKVLHCSTKEEVIDNHKLEITNKSPESLWKDVHMVCDCDKNVRNIVKKDSCVSNLIDIKGLIESVTERLKPIECQFWRDCGLTLVGTALKKYGNSKYDDFIRSSILPSITCTALNQKLKSWMEFKDGIRTKDSK